MIHLDDIPLPKSSDNSPSQIIETQPANESGQQGNLLLQDFLKKRLDESDDEDAYDSELLLKINHILEKEVLGGDEDEFDDGQTFKSTKNTDDNVAEQIALIRSHLAKAKDEELAKLGNPLNQPLLDSEIENPQAAPLKEDHYLPAAAFESNDQQTVFYDVQSVKEESEMNTVQDYEGDFRFSHAPPHETKTENETPTPPQPAEQTQPDTQSELDDCEFHSALDFQSVYNFSKHGDAK